MTPAEIADKFAELSKALGKDVTLLVDGDKVCFIFDDVANQVDVVKLAMAVNLNVDGEFSDTVAEKLDAAGAPWHNWC